MGRGVAAGFPVFFALVCFPPFFRTIISLALRSYSICHLFWSDSPELTATFSRS